MADQATLRKLGGANGANAGRSSWDAQNSRSDRLHTGNGPDPSASGVVSNVAGFGESLLTLVELQARLTTVELRQNFDSVKTGGALLLTGILLAIATAPVLLLGVAELMVSELGMKRGYALLAEAAAVGAVAGCCIAIARSWLRRSPLGLQMTTEEFARNLNWLRTILRHSGR